MPEILIDADGCPVIEQTLEIAEQLDFPVTLIADSSHVFSKYDCTIIQTDKGRDRADFVLLRIVKKDDIVITQDYGLAALALSKKAHVLSQNGLRYTDDTIDALLYQRSCAAKARRAKQHYDHMKKRTAKDNQDFCIALQQLLEEV